MEQVNAFGFREDCGGRRRIKDRRVLVSAPPDRERRTSWKRRSGFDRRRRAYKTHAVFERLDTPENYPAA
jgi:hypothetical protein